MNSTAFTNLESLFLFKLLRKYGLADDVFNRVSDELKSNHLICEQERYAAGRLGPESLQEHALQLIRDEMPQAVASVSAGGQNASTNGNATGNTGSLSPTAKKRKLSSPPLPTLKDVREQADRVVPVLLAVLHERYKQQMVREIREDEDKILNLQREVAELEKKESARAVVQQPQQPQQPVQPEHKAAATNGTPAPSAEEPRTAKPSRPNGHITQTPIPVPTPPQLQQQQQQQQQQPQQQQQQQQSVAANKPAAPTPVSQSPLPQDRRAVQPTPTPTPTPTPPAPPSNVRPPSEVRQTTPVSRPSETPRPPSAASSGLQHPQAAQAYGLPQPSASPQPHLPEGNLQRPESLPRTQTPGPRPRPSPQPQTPSTLQWEPPYRPQHQTPVPSPRPPYAPQQNVRQPGYPIQAQAGHPPQQQQQHQYPPNYPANRQAPPPVTQPPQPARTPTPGTTQAPQSVLVPPQHAGQLPPSLGSLPLNATPDGSGQQPPQHRPGPVIPTTGPPTSASPAPHFPQAQAYQYQAQQATRPPAPAPQQVSTPVRAPSVILPTNQRPPVPSQPQPPPRQYPPPAPPAPSTPKPQQQTDTSSKPRGPPYPGHLSGRAEQPQHQTPVQNKPPLAISTSQTPSAVHTPVHTPSGSQLMSHVIRGHGTKWTSTPTPATPRVEMTGYFDVPSPSYEPLSPPTQHAQLPKASHHSGKKDPRKGMQKIDTAATRPKSRLSQSSQIVQDTADDHDTPARAIKNEEATPKAFDDMGGEGGLMIPRSTKRKREESPEEAVSSEPPTHVLWTRAFHRVSAQALEQVTSHKHANMFAGPVKVRDAPNYSEIVLQPMDLKKIRAAIHQGQRHAQNVEKTQSDIEPSAMNVWLPTTADLVPPRGIINIAQLERELVHMFANATMYAPDPDRGFGLEFIKKRGEDDSEDDEGVLGYEVDENGIVKQTRNMFMEVEKLLGDLRSEVERNAQPAGIPPLSRSVSMVGGEATAGEEDDEQAGDDAPSVSKRRRVRG
ncbi:Bromodomain protein [Apiospora rasikravindrae]|uniref:Bromodomain protein n=1 Tax=Apiospora rasikravindrae TaxID=990691 RepID=A0ABR1SZR0_9PEZI